MQVAIHGVKGLKMVRAGNFNQNLQSNDQIMQQFDFDSTLQLLILPLSVAVGGSSKLRARFLCSASLEDTHSILPPVLGFCPSSLVLSSYFHTHGRLKPFLPHKLQKDVTLDPGVRS